MCNVYKWKCYFSSMYGTCRLLFPKRINCIDSIDCDCGFKYLTAAEQFLCHDTSHVTRHMSHVTRDMGPPAACPAWPGTCGPCSRASAARCSSSWGAPCTSCARRAPAPAPARAAPCPRGWPRRWTASTWWGWTCAAEWGGAGHPTAVHSPVGDQVPEVGDGEQQGADQRRPVEAVQGRLAGRGLLASLAHPAPAWALQRSTTVLVWGGLLLLLQTARQKSAHYHLHHSPHVEITRWNITSHYHTVADTAGLWTPSLN